MSGAWPLVAALEALEDAQLGADALHDLTVTLEAIDPMFPNLIGTLAEEFGLPPPERRRRCAAICLLFAAVQLADDLADGECSYLADAARRGSGAQWLLQHLATGLLLQSTCSPAELVAAAAHFSRMGATQQMEVRREQWDLATAQQAATGLNGSQFAAYFGILADGTAWAEHAEGIGHDFGEVLHVVGDRFSRDRRITTLTEADQQALCQWARERLHRLSDTGLVVVRRTAIWFATVLASGATTSRTPLNGPSA
jgi:hypothetical protein